MKYRRLTTEELAELETEFIRFLVSNTVTGDDWEKIKKEDPKKAEGLIEIFSDIVFDKTISKIEYLEMKTPKDLKIFRCNKDDIELMGLKIEGESDLDLTADLSSLSGLTNGDTVDFRFYFKEQNNRNETAGM